MSLHSWIKDIAQCVEVPGRPAWVFPSFGSFFVYCLLESQLIQNLWNLLEINKIYVEHGVKLILFSKG